MPALPGIAWPMEPILEAVASGWGSSPGDVRERRRIEIRARRSETTAQPFAPPVPQKKVQSQ
jgi:hypothetical protein